MLTVTLQNIYCNKLFTYQDHNLYFRFSFWPFRALSRLPLHLILFICSSPKCNSIRGPLHDPVTWYKIKYTGKQVAQWHFLNNAPAFVLEVPLRNLLTSIFNFVPCDWVVQRAYKCGYAWVQC